MGKKHKIAPEVKEEILKKVRAGETSVLQAAKDYGVSDASIYTWLGGGVKGSPTWSEFSKLRKERDELLRLVGELTVQLSTAQKKS